MKSYKLLSAGLLAVSFAGLASAQTIVRVAGSSAFRSATVQAEIDVVSFDATGAVAAPTMAAAKGDVKADSRSIIHGWMNDAAHTEVYFENNWTGSAAGVVDLTSGNTSLKWYPTSTPLAVSPGTNISTLGSQPVDVLAAPSVAMSDVASSEVAASITSAGAVGVNFANAISAASIVDGGTVPGPVAVATFRWVLGKQSAAAPFSNLTQQQASALISNGSLALGVITGNTTDMLDFVFFVGRNEDSGTRITYLAESQLQPQFGGSPAQWMLKQDALAYPLNNAYASLAAGTTVTGLKLWPKTAGANSWSVNTIPTLDWKTKGHSGYNGGGDVVAVLSTNNPVTGFDNSVNTDLPVAWVNGTSKAYFVSCLGTSDAAKVVTAGGTPLTYNGVPFSVNAVIAGQYSLYSVEHLYRLTSATGTQVVAPAAVANALADKLNTYTAGQIGAAGVPDPVVGVRAGTGAPIN